ncbi:MAG: type IV secretory system conjugative DNA transfer family protein [Candidatus Thiodiazotropha sp.]|nr:type IV secretory system conjugative DNA transfer family protein [Candidatus Thiodiazotropha sp.]
MFSRVTQVVDGFLIERANEALAVAVFFGPHPAAWFGAGLVPVALVFTCARIGRILPDEVAWQLTALRFVARSAGYALVISPLIVGVYLYFAKIGGEMAWSAHNQAAFWPFLSQYGKWTAAGASAGILVGYAAWAWIARHFEPWLSETLHRGTQKADRDGSLTDVRSIESQLPADNLQLDHYAVFDQARTIDAIFLGVSEHQNAVLVPRSEWKTSHVEVVGPPGTGKGVLAGITLSQSVEYGDGVIIFDPKSDEWARHVLAQTCERAGVPFALVDLRTEKPQINPIKGATSKEVAELFTAGMGLGRQGGEADFYRAFDRKAARLAARLADEEELSIPEIFDRLSEAVDGGLLEKATGFVMQLEELAEIEAINTRGGADLADPIERGGVLYIVGSMRSEPIVALMKMLIIRALQIIENRPPGGRHVSIFADELKYLISTPLLNGLGTVRDKGCNFILTHQALGDLRAGGKDIDPEAAVDGILTNTPLKWIYRAKDPATAEWAAKLTGQILVDKTRRMIDRNELLAETIQSTRQIDQEQRALIDENTIQHLPNGCAVCITTGIAQLAFAKPIPTVKREIPTIEAAPVSRVTPGQMLIETEPEEDQQPATDPGDELL